MQADTDDITDDAILNGRLRLLQPRRGHRFGHDAILLAAAVPARPGQRVAEFGAGVGAASLALLARVQGIDATLIEIDAGLADLANRNIARNGFADRARAIPLDVMAPAGAFAAAGLRENAFDHVFMNPPFNDASRQPSPSPARRSAHAGDAELLRDWVGRAAGLLSDGGAATVIWRADGLAEVLQILEADFGGLSLIPIYPAPGRAAIRVIVSGRRGSRAPMQVLPALTLNDAQQRPTAEAEAILRGGSAWPVPAP